MSNSSSYPYSSPASGNNTSNTTNPSRSNQQANADQQYAPQHQQPTGYIQGPDGNYYPIPVSQQQRQASYTVSNHHWSQGQNGYTSANGQTYAAHGHSTTTPYISHGGYQAPTSATHATTANHHANLVAQSTSQYWCAECQIGFGRQQELDRHLERAAAHVGAGQYVCSECGKRYSRLDSLTRHLRNVHNIGAAN